MRLQTRSQRGLCTGDDFFFSFLFCQLIVKHQCSFLWSESVAPAGTSYLGIPCNGLATHVALW